MSGISKILKPRFTPIFTKYNLKHMVIFTIVTFLGAMLVSDYYDSKTYELNHKIA
jgi:hypothetical protein